MLHRRPASPFRLGRPPGGAPVLIYMGLMTILNVFGIATVGHLAYRISDTAGFHFDFYYFWFQPSSFGVSLVSHLMAVNGLLLVYLWLHFRAEKPSMLMRRVTFMLTALVLMAFQWLYLEIGTVEPPKLEYRRLPIHYVYPLPDPTPDGPESV